MMPLASKSPQSVSPEARTARGLRCVTATSHRAAQLTMALAFAYVAALTEMVNELSAARTGSHAVSIDFEGL